MPPTRTATSAASRASASGVSTSMSIASVPRSISRTRCACLAIRLRAPTSPVQRQHLGEQVGRPQHRVAALALMHRHDDRRSRLGGERGDHRIEMRRLDPRHVAQQHQRSVRSLGQRADAGFQRAAEPRREVGIGHERDIEPGQRRAHVVGLMARHHQDRPRLARQCRLHGVPHHRLAADVGQQLVGRAHARRAPGGQHDGGDVARTGSLLDS